MGHHTTRPQSDELVIEISGYFAQIPEWVLDAEISDRAVRLYCALWRHADKADRTCFPTRAKLADRIRCSESSLDRAMKELAAIGAVIITRRRTPEGDPTSNLYTLQVVPTGEGTPTAAAAPGVTDDEEVASPVTNKPESVNQSQKEPEPVASDVAEIVEHLKRCAVGHGMVKATVKTAPWERPVDLLLRRGSLDADPEPIPAQEIHDMIDLVFTRGSVHSSSGFCWADQVQSGNALRRHWPKLCSWAARQDRPARSSNMSAVDEVMELYGASGAAPGELLGFGAGE